MRSRNLKLRFEIEGERGRQRETGRRTGFEIEGETERGVAITCCSRSRRLAIGDWRLGISVLAPDFKPSISVLHESTTAIADFITRIRFLRTLPLNQSTIYSGFVYHRRLIATISGALRSSGPKNTDRQILFHNHILHSSIGSTAQSIDHFLLSFITGVFIRSGVRRKKQTLPVCPRHPGVYTQNHPQVLKWNLV
ncbi:hypothetical protein LXL04_017813 [Taraxacum kok-saghyz]